MHSMEWAWTPPPPEPFVQPIVDNDQWRILICLFGRFRVLGSGQPIPLRGGGKTEDLLATLALRDRFAAHRDTLLASIWPDSDQVLAGQSLNSLVYSLNKLVGDRGISVTPILHEDGWYRLNVAAGIGVDVACFQELANAANRARQAGNQGSATALYRRALGFYDGDLCGGSDGHAALERERLRAIYLNILARLADDSYAGADYDDCLDCALRLLANDPCREDAHRLVMRCYVRRGERAQALRQYRLCEEILRTEFDATPEPATRALFDQVRRDPTSL